LNDYDDDDDYGALRGEYTVNSNDDYEGLGGGGGGGGDGGGVQLISHTNMNTYSGGGGGGGGADALSAADDFRSVMMMLPQRGVSGPSFRSAFHPVVPSSGPIVSSPCILPTLFFSKRALGRKSIIMDLPYFSI
jgi:hypothetical protein